MSGHLTVNDLRAALDAIRAYDIPAEMPNEQYTIRPIPADAYIDAFIGNIKQSRVQPRGFYYRPRRFRTMRQLLLELRPKIGRR